MIDSASHMRASACITFDAAGNSALAVHIGRHGYQLHLTTSASMSGSHKFVQAPAMNRTVVNMALLQRR